MVELFLSFKISCTNCGVDCIYRERLGNKLDFPWLVCKICKFRMAPWLLFGLRLGGNNSIECYTFDCEECGEFNVIDEIKESVLCCHCHENNTCKITLII